MWSSVWARFLRPAGILLGVLLFVLPLMAAVSLLPAFRAAERAGVPVRDVLFLNGTTYAHMLLPDGQLEISLTDTARHREDADRIARLFPAGGERRQVLDWGRALVRQCVVVHRRWLGTVALQDDLKPKLSPKTAAFEAMLAAVDMSDDRLAAHAAWLRLTVAPGADAAELPGLRTVVADAVGDPKRLAALLEWAGRRRTALSEPLELPPPLHHVVIRPSPPDTEWFRHWIVWEQCLPVERMFLARKNELLDIFGGPAPFGPDKMTAMLAWGRQVAAERLAAGDAFPLEGDRAAIVALVDRLSGLDPVHSPKVRAVAESLVSGDGLLMKPEALEGHGIVVGSRMTSSAAVFFPFNDDLPMFGNADAQRRPGRFYRIAEAPGLPDRLPETADGDKLPGREVRDEDLAIVLLTSGMLVYVLGWMTFAGMRVVAVGGFGRLLGLREDKRFINFRDHLYDFVGLQLAFMAVVMVSTWLLFVYTADPVQTFWTRGAAGMLYGTALLVTIAGTATEGLRNIVTLVLIRLGSDPERTFVDDVLGIGLSATLMWSFGTDWSGILAGIAAGELSPWVFRKIGTRIAG